MKTLVRILVVFACLLGLICTLASCNILPELEGYLPSPDGDTNPPEDGGDTNPPEDGGDTNPPEDGGDTIPPRSASISMATGLW